MAEAGIAQSDIVLNHAEGGPRATMVYNRYAYDKENRRALETRGRVLKGILDERRQEGRRRIAGFNHDTHSHTNTANPNNSTTSAS